jgi:single-strand DNA-binding protein
MSGSLNKVTLIGHLGKDPEIRRTQDGRPIASFSLATSESWKTASGEKKERSDWHQVVVFNEGLAGIAEKYLKKGSKAYVEGKLQTRSWDDQQGQKRYTTEVVLTGFDAKIILLDGTSSRPPAATSADDYGRPTGSTRSPAATGMGSDMDDEIPF